MKTILIITLLIASIQGFAQPSLPILKESEVDKRVELVSIVFRLAEKREYSSTLFKLYTDRIESYFDKYKDHELITFTKSVLLKKGIGYDAVMEMAIRLDGDLNLLEDISNHSLYGRWEKKDADRFIQLLKKFCEDTAFDSFYADNTELYAEVVKRFAPIYKQIDLNWFSDFYGEKPTDSFLIINGIGNGGCNYGLSLNYANGEKEIYAILGTWRTDNSGMPYYMTNEYLPTLIHEFNHSFVNHLTEKHKKTIKTGGKKIFKELKDKMSKQAYNHWKIMTDEAIVRAAVIKYMKDHNFDENVINNEINEQKERGFLWIEEFVSELENYDMQRAMYPTFNDYIPQLAETYKVYAKKIQSRNKKRPKIVSIQEFSNGDSFVNPDIKTITINFDKTLSGKGYSIFYGNKGEETFPSIEKISYANNNRSVIIEVKLQKNKEYQFIMKGTYFTSTDGIGIDDYEVHFKTGE